MSKSVKWLDCGKEKWNLRWQTVFTVTAPYFMGDGTTFSPKFEKKGKEEGQEKNECLEGLKEILPQMFAWGSLLCFLSKKSL